MINQLCMELIRATGAALLWPIGTLAQGQYIIVCARRTSCPCPSIVVLIQPSFLTLQTLCLSREVDGQVHVSKLSNQHVSMFESTSASAALEYALLQPALHTLYRPLGTTCGEDLSSLRMPCHVRTEHLSDFDPEMRKTGHQPTNLRHRTVFSQVQPYVQLHNTFCILFL
jgi:hypothetical protein